jgi:hypothetical protein
MLIGTFQTPNQNSSGGAAPSILKMHHAEKLIRQLLERWRTPQSPTLSIKYFPEYYLQSKNESAGQ